jgi:hypothetical protein
MDNNSTRDIYEILGSKIESEQIKQRQISVLGVLLQTIKVWLKTKYPDIIVFAGYIFGIYRLLYMIISCCRGIYFLTDNVLPEITVSLILGIIMPIAVWLYSTCFDFWSFQNRKIFGLTLVILNAGLVFESLVFRAVATLFLPLVFKIPISPDITPGMVITLARCLMTLVLILTAFGVYNMILKNMYHKSSIKSIMYYKLNRGWDVRKNKHYCYDMNIVRYLSTGKMHRVYEEDRFLHCMSIGTTGTGKTSTCLTVSINNDFDQRVKNEDTQKRKLSKLLSQGKIRMTRDFDDADFSASYFEADSQKYKKKLKKIQESAMPVGVTAMAPNEKFSDELYVLAKSKSIKVNRIDPNLVNGCHKEGFIGFNPLYISPALEGIEKKLEIYSKARVFADVNQAIFEKDESGDIYFTGLNHNLTTSITVMVLLTYPSLNNGKQPTPDVVQDIINDFDKARKYRDEMIIQYSTKFNRPEEKKDPIMDIGKADIGEYQFILDVIDKDIIGQGRKTMEDQARGLRNIINETLSNPLIRNVLCAENTIDIDKVLDKGQVTFVNYAINLGSAGTAFGMFYLLSFINAVLRRPAGKKLLPHFFYIDELPELLHPDLGRTFALFRQYCVGMFVALQSLDLLDKSPKTRYLKSVIVGGCAHQIVFGRCSTNEMKLYQDFGGTREEVTESFGTTETALSTENPTMSMTRRETVEKVNVLESGEMRYKDFREVTMFTVTKGSPVLPFYGKTFFLEDIKKIEKRRFLFNWSMYFKPNEGFRDEVKALSKSATITSSTNVSEHERTVKGNLKDQTGQIKAEKQSVTIIESQQKEIRESQFSSDQVFISSGKDICLKESNDFVENEGPENNGPGVISVNKGIDEEASFEIEED